MDKPKIAEENLRRGLHDRHIQLIAIGGAIGGGLFYGSAGAIKAAGPGILLTYILAGLILFLVLRALGEIAVVYPVSGSFSQYASTFLGPKYGYITGWNYWYQWLVGCMCEITAVAVYMKFWYPNMDQWIPALVALVFITLVNIASVKFYGEFEFWFALIKVVTIIGMIIIGALMIIFGIGNGGIATGISNLWTNGGFFPMGVTGVISASAIVMFAYQGTETIGITAGEAQDPSHTMASAIDKVFWRILIFYVGALFVIMSLYPWNQIGTMGSPFAVTFRKLGIEGAAAIINFVVLTAALSACNSGIYASGRLLYSLSLRGEAPSFFSKLNASQVPMNAILVSSLVVLVGVVLNYTLPAKAWSIVTSICVSSGIWTWFMISVTQISFRKGLSPEQLADLKYRMPGSPYTNWICIAFLALVTVTMLLNEDTRIAIYIAPIWFGLLYVTYTLFVGKKEVTSNTTKA